MKFKIKNRWNGSVIYTAEIECDEGAPYAVKLGLAVRDAVLTDAVLTDADLRNAVLRNADLTNAVLTNAVLTDAVLTNAVLTGADLRNATGNMREIRSMQAGTYSVVWTKDIMQIGCERHSIADWMAFSEDAIFMIDGDRALDFWRTWKTILMQIVDATSAKTPGDAVTTENSAGEVAS